ncbi:MAG: response regulator [Nitrospinota bacterium]
MSLNPKECQIELGQRHVVIVDDLSYITRIMKKMTERLGHKATTFNSSIDTLEYIRSGDEQVDLLVTDIKMPNMSGVELVKNIREFDRGLEIIVMTGFGSLEAAIQAIVAGTSDFITKPVDEKRYSHSVRRSLERVVLNEKLMERTNQLIHSDKLGSIGVLATGVAHEIDNPNTFIRSNLQLLKKMTQKLATLANEDNFENNINTIRSLVSNKLPMLIDESLKGSVRIESIVSKITHFSHKEKIQFEEQIDITKVIESSLKLVKLRLGDDLEINIESNLNSKIAGSSSKLEQVFINLLLNASDSIKEKSKKLAIMKQSKYHGLIEVTVCENKIAKTDATEEKKELIIKVKDNGAGIAADRINSLFEPFNTTKEPGKGTGLGLYICFHIIKSHRGNISVESEYGKGASFVIQLPVVQ